LDNLQKRPAPAGALELWGGLECTVNRVADGYLDQCQLNGHCARIDDLERFASLGIRALRYPLIWENVAPGDPDRCDWSWGDERLPRLRDLGVRPIVGLVHHGSGPRHTHLLDDGFAPGLEQYAGKVAERYPWIDAYTPVNEPLTTARFAALYGHWYPHARDERSFLRALLNECRATVLAMRAIRKVNPAAQLVQTDDLGKTYATRRLRYQADFENERRWFTWDLLCGRIGRGHAMFAHMRSQGLSDAEILWFEDNPCPPSVIGVNHYVTSERFLDHRLERYPSHTHGGNGRDAYADVEAVRVRAEGIGGMRMAITEAWERYGIPIAVTEAHLGCTREEQLRWLHRAWEDAQEARATGADVRAVTAWSLIGAYEWNSLLTARSGHYETGVFDLRGGELRETALAPLMRDLSADRAPTNPVVALPGWWERQIRLQYPAVVTEEVLPENAVAVHLRPKARPILITGATGTLGRAFARLCELRGLPYRIVRRQEMDITDVASVTQTIQETNPWAVVNTAGFVRVDEAESSRSRCLAENAQGAEILARACAASGIRLVTFSSDLVFDGTRQTPYVETDEPNPINVYGESKAMAERLVRAADPTALVIRTSAFFGPWDAHNFVHRTLKALAAGEAVDVPDDTWISATYVPDLVHASLDLLIDGENGIWHLANVGAVTWASLARMAARIGEFDQSLVRGRATASFGWPAARPHYSVLESRRGGIMPSLESGLNRFFSEVEVPWLPVSGPSIRAYAA